MSAITFESRTRSVKVSGAERANASILTNQLATDLLEPDKNKELILKAIPARHYLHDKSLQGASWSRNLYTALYAGAFNFEVNGNAYDTFQLVLDTASTMGDDDVIMLARIHAQCELHGFVNGENRSWMSDIISNASHEVFRPGYGWDQVVELLRESNEGPVVMSYSVGDSFLSTMGTEWVHENFDSLDIKIEEDEYDECDEDDLEELKFERAFDNWGELSRDEQWDYASKWIDEQTGKGLEINPSVWPLTYSYNGMTAQKLLEELNEQYS